MNQVDSYVVAAPCMATELPATLQSATGSSKRFLDKHDIGRLIIWISFTVEKSKGTITSGKEAGSGHVRCWSVSA